MSCAVDLWFKAGASRWRMFEVKNGLDEARPSNKFTSTYPQHDA